MLDVKGLPQRSTLRRFGAILGLVVALVTASVGPAHAQRFGTMHQAFGSCSAGGFLPFTISFATIPTVVMLIGNAVTLNKPIGRAWGIAGGVVSGVGLTAEMSFLVGIWSASRSSCDSSFTVASVAFLALHMTTAGLSMANIVKSEQRLSRRLIALRKQRLLEWRERRSQRNEPRPKVLKPLASGTPKQNGSKAGSAKLRQSACQHIYALYRATLNDALTTEDKEQSEALLDKLESQYDYCFKSYEGKLFLQQRKTILQGIQPRLPRDAPLPSVDRRQAAPRRLVKPARRKATVRVAPRTRPRAITRKAPPQRRNAPPQRRKADAIPDSILNQIAAGKMPVTRRTVPRKAPAARRKVPATREPAQRRTTSPPPSDRTPPRGWLLRLEL